jgi:hypothetical protein
MNNFRARDLTTDPTQKPGQGLAHAAGREWVPYATLGAIQMTVGRTMVEIAGCQRGTDQEAPLWLAKPLDYVSHWLRFIGARNREIQAKTTEHRVSTGVRN